ncbi:MAG: HAMP domain-containing histidine kinase [Proteobacteria bacterium]|nr:HAMP domain-containing histidine kinase [Pseudomonadota bacterium]
MFIDDNQILASWGGGLQVVYLGACAGDVAASSAEIVHNLSNPLTTLYAYLRRLEKADPDNPDIKEIKAASRKLGAITQSILSSVRTNDSEEKRELDLNAIIRSELKLIEIDTFAKYEVETLLKLSPLPGVLGVGAHFNQVFGNIIKNAVDAMHDSPRKVLTVSSRSTGGWVVVEISDTGCGVPPHHMKKVFDPLFTTKTSNGLDGRPTGTGLGLSSCKRMIEAYGGVITLNSVVNQGTTVTVKVPLFAPAVLAQKKG